MLKLGIRRPLQAGARRNYRILAVESSCDDSCVALLDKYLASQPPRVIDQAKATLNSAPEGGINPTKAYEYHHHALAPLVRNFCQKHRITPDSPPDLICCTRGPGMVGSLSAGLQMAKGLAVAWNKPLIGVHHMLGHALIAKLPKSTQPNVQPPSYPFLSLLCSGGHTMLILLKSITDHEIVINTMDIAAGEGLDKCGRELGLVGNMIGKELEQFVKNIPETAKEEFKRIKTHTRDNEFNFQLAKPLRSAKFDKIPDELQFTFAGFVSSIKHLRKTYYEDKEFDMRTKQFLAFKIQEILFDHIVDRINVAILKHGKAPDVEFSDGKFAGVKDFICSGGVAANDRLREKLFSDLNYDKNLGIARLDMQFHYPDISLCTDNAVMIGVAGAEIFETLKVKSDLSIYPIRRWPMNELLDVDGWVKVKDEELERTCKY